MSTNNDGYEALTAGDSRDDLAGTPVGGGGSGGAALGVLLTLVIGCGLVFAAYKLGQRTSVDDIPTILAEGGPAKMAPIDEGGTIIPNTDNDAYTMVDGSSPERFGYVERDGIIVEEPLSARQLAPIDPLAGGDAQQDVISVSELRPVGAISGEPSLTAGVAPDRADERLLAGGAEVSITNAEAILNAAERNAANAAQGGLDAAGSIANSAQNGLNNATGAVAGAVGSTFVTGGQQPTTSLANTQSIQVPNPNALNTGVDTVVAVPPAPAPTLASASGSTPVPPGELSAETFGSGLIVPLPRIKPDLGPRIAAVERARATVRPQISRQPAAATTLVIPQQTQQGLAPAPALQAQPVGIPPQPIGDAQVQLGAMPTPDLVRQRWRDLQGRNPDILGALGLQVLPVRTAQGQELFRLRVGPLSDSQTAARLCDQLRFRGIECFVPAR